MPKRIRIIEGKEKEERVEEERGEREMSQRENKEEVQVLTTQQQDPLFERNKDTVCL